MLLGPRGQHTDVVAGLAVRVTALGGLARLYLHCLAAFPLTATTGRFTITESQGQGPGRRCTFRLVVVYCSLIWADKDKGGLESFAVPSPPVALAI